MNPIFLLILSLLCFVTAAALWREKWGFLIPSLKKMDPEKKDFQKVYRTNAVEVLILGIAVLACWVCLTAGVPVPRMAFPGLFVVILAGSLLYENTGNRFDKK